MTAGRYTNRHGKSWRPPASLAALGLAALVLSGCSSTDKLLGDLMGGERDVVLPGKRESVLAPSGSGLRVATDPVAVPAARRNASWSQPGGNAANANHNLDLPRTLRRAFAVSAGAGSDSSGRLSAPPIVVGGRVFVLDAKAAVRAFSATNGGRIWAVSLVPKGEDEDDGFGGGLASDGRVIYAATGFGEVVALSAANGAQIWRKKLELPVRTAPVTMDGRVYVRDNGNTIHALNAANGSEIWKQQGAGAQASLISASAPAIGGNMVVVPFTSGELAAYTARDGYGAWTQNLASRSDSTITDIAGRPVIDGGAVYAVASTGRLAAFQLKDGAEIWSLNLSGRQTPWVAGDYLFHISGKKRLSAIARRDGGIKWTMTLPGGSWSGPVMGGGRLIAASSNGTLVEISPQTGQIMNRRKLGESVYITPVIANGTLFVLTDEGTLMAFR